MPKPKSWYEIWLRKDATFNANPQVKDFILGSSGPQDEFISPESIFMHHVSPDCPMPRHLACGDVLQLCDNTKDGRHIMCVSYLICRTDLTHQVHRACRVLHVSASLPDFAMVKLASGLPHTFMRSPGRKS